MSKILHEFDIYSRRFRIVETELGKIVWVLLEYHPGSDRRGADFDWIVVTRL